MTLSKPKHTTTAMVHSFFHKLCFLQNTNQLRYFFFKTPWNFAITLTAAIVLLSFSYKPADSLGFSVQFSKNHPALGDTLQIIFKASVPHGYHMYSEKSDCPADDGPMRAEWTFDAAEGIQFIGSPLGIGDHMVKDNEIFKCSTGEFEGICEFRQTIVITGAVHNFNAHFLGQKCSADGICSLVREDVAIMLHIH